MRIVTLCIGTATDILHHVRLNIGGAAQAGTQLHVVVIDPDLHLEVCDFFLGSGAGRLTGVRDLRDRAFELALAVGVDRDDALSARPSR